MWLQFEWPKRKVRSTHFFLIGVLRLRTATLASLIVPHLQRDTNTVLPWSCGVDRFQSWSHLVWAIPATLNTLVLKRISPTYIASHLWGPVACFFSFYSSASPRQLPFLHPNIASSLPFLGPVEADQSKAYPICAPAFFSQAPSLQPVVSSYASLQDIVEASFLVPAEHWWFALSATNRQLL